MAWMIDRLDRVNVRSRHGYFAFFFQAEDGIRDVAVTGVQTCALPISFGRASLMFSALPSTVAPFNAAIAFSPSPSLSISTNPKPGGCPESRSVQILDRKSVV